MNNSNQAIPERVGNEVFTSDFDRLLAFHADELSPAEAESIAGGGKFAQAWFQAQVGEAAFSVVGCLKSKLLSLQYTTLGEAAYKSHHTA